MARSTVSGPWRSLNGFEGDLSGSIVKLAAIAVASLPAAAAGNAGTVYFVSGTTSGNTLVFSNGTANIDLVTGVAVVAAP